jgi:hypothetical protein
MLGLLIAYSSAAPQNILTMGVVKVLGGWYSVLALLFVAVYAIIEKQRSENWTL